MPSRRGATRFGSVRGALLKKVEAQVELATELAEMRLLLEAALLRAAATAEPAPATRP